MLPIIEPVKESTTLSVEKIVDLIRSIRNELVLEFLEDDQLSSYFKEKFSKELTKVKKEFLKRDLKELLTTPVDLVHYSKLINQIRETNTAALAEKSNELFYREFDPIFKKYSY